MDKYERYLMTMWILIMWVIIALLAVSLGYLGLRIPKFFAPETVVQWTKVKLFLIAGWSVIGFMGLMTLCIDFVNAIVCALYLAMIWGISDLFFWLVQKIFHISFQHYYAGYIAILMTVFALSVGWYLNHHVWCTTYHLTTSKKVSPLKIAMFADSHMGTTFDAKGFEKHLQAIQAQNPDLIVVVGDYVDDGTTKDDMIQATQALGKVKTKYGIFFVFGNHDKGYYGSAYRGFSAQELVDELQKNNIVVMQDEVVQIADSYHLIGRRDFSVEKEQKGRRTSMQEFIKNLDKNKYMIVLDHQPADYKNQAKSGVDLVLSGHTHGGQLFPFNPVGKWIGANDFVYGHEKHHKTDFIVTSGISDWAIQFKTGTKSEFVIIQIHP